ncbi:hypothetical protein MMC08_009063, partial [Hypocenomyce scalaris]|nr:hypothetical protein [Hypocenomyce scalaris]
PYVLPWIQALATLKDLKFLVFASQSLTTLIRKRRNIDASRMPLLHRLSDLDLLEHWATDLLKVVGKFGGHLLQDPTTIYRFIPQFCPHNSILYRQFGKALSSPLSVTGLSNRDWDDCLARVSVGSEHQALMVTCSGRYLAVLTSARTIVLWDSRTFEEFRTLSHREHIFAMCFSASGGELASYGFLTTRIWSVSSGRQLHKVANPTDRALCLAFAENDTVLLMGSDLRRVKKLSLDDTLEGWQALNSSLLQEDSSLEGTFLNSPTALAFNSDTTQIAVAYRGFPLTVWALTSPRLINRCKRRLGHNTNPMNAWTGVNRVLWHPHSGEVLGIYTDGIVFKWHPLEESHHELKADLHATPSEVQCSPDGHVFGTSDVHGTVKLYNFHHFTLIYQLSSENIVTALCFSPDSKRFYDLRGSYCNAWEPNVLIRLSDTDEGANEIDTEERSVTISYQASEVWAETPVPITALSAQWQGSLLCAGNDEGVVEMYDIANGTKLGVGKSATEFTIDYLTWGEDGKHFAYAEIGGKLAVKCIEAQAGGQNKVPWGYRSVMSVKLNLEAGRIHQLLLSPGSDFLLVVSLNGAQLWSLQTQSIKAIYTSTEPGVLQKWASHPSNRGQVLAFTPSMVTACSWDSLQKVGQWKIKLPPGHMLDEVEEEQPVLSSISSLQEPMSTVGNNEIIDEVIVPQAEGYILLHISGHGQHRRARSQLRIIDVASLRETAAGGSATLEPIPVPADVAAAIERPLNVLGRDRLVFLDRSFWICTWRLRHAGGPGPIAQAAAQTVLGVYIFSRHGDRTAKSTPPTNLTDLGYQEVFTSGTYFRDRYIADGATTQIVGISPNVVKYAQISASAPLDTVLMPSVQGFLQGLYPPVGETLGSQTLGNGTVIQTPLNGFQLIPVAEVTSGTGSESSGWLQGSSNCENSIVSSNEYFTTPSYLQLLNSTQDFYTSLTPVINGTFSPSEISYKNAYTIFDLINVAEIHNASINDSQILTNETLFQVRTLADQHEFNLAYNASSPIRAVTGSVIAAQVVQALNSTITGNGSTPLNVQFGAYGGFQSFFGQANLTQVNVDFFGVPDYASTMTFELSTNGSAHPFPSADDINVRFLFHNGTTSNISQPVAYPLFGQSELYLPWSAFVSGMNGFAIGSQAQWCSACGNNTGSCSPSVLSGTSTSTGSSPSASSTPSSSSSGGISKAVAGVIGAMVTLAVVLGIEALVMLAGGWRLVSKKQLSGSGGAGAAVDQTAVSPKA